MLLTTTWTKLTKGTTMKVLLKREGDKDGCVLCWGRRSPTKVSGESLLQCPACGRLFFPKSTKPAANQTVEVSR